MMARSVHHPIRQALLTRQGQAIIEARRRMGLSRDEAALALGVTVYAIASWEQGARACTLGQRRRIVAEWGADAAELDTEHDVCPHCGRPYELVAQSTRPNRKRKRRART